jgi:hypothetical protein
MNSRRIGVMALVAGAALCAPDGARAQDPPTVRTVSGKAYEGEHLALVDSSTPLYTLSVTIEKSPGVDRMQVVDFDRSGANFFTQTIDFDGASPKGYAFSNSVANQTGKLTVSSTELVMELTEGGKTKVSREARPTLFAVGPSVTRLVEQHVADLSAGRTVVFSLVVVNRLATYSFRAIREPASSTEPIQQIKSGQWMRVRIEPDSGIARIFASKIVSIVDARTGQTLAVNGPIPSPSADGGIIKGGTIRYEGFR